MNESQLKFVSLGIVIEPKARNTDFIKVTPIEALPLQSGDIGSDQRQYQTNVPDASGVKRVSQVQGSNYVVAKWMPDGHDNRITAPDVQKGETVKLYRYADTDEYHWTTIFREPKLRKLETVLYGFSNQSGAGEFDKSTSYWYEISTHDKRIQIHTSQNDGEPFGYDITIDAATGVLTITDSVDNRIVLNSQSNSIDLTANTSINLKAPTINLEATTVNVQADDINLKGKVNIDKQVTGLEGASFLQDVTAPNI